jgi:hypothetical protein
VRQQIKRLDDHDGKSMSDADDTFTKATDSLIALYRSVERSTLDLPLVSFMPFLIFLWAVMKFMFFLYVGIFLIIPVNLVILIRNVFPGHWRYRPFFLAHLYYMWLWLWRGEAPTAPSIFIRPLLTVVMKAHFERRLRRLRLEILDSELSEATRPALLNRVDAGLERWKAPRFTAVFWSVVLPAIIALPGWHKQLVESLGSLGIRMPTEMVANFLSEKMTTDSWIFIAMSLPGYLLAIPITAFLAKRGLFVGRSPDRICFPGGQGGFGIYAKEREILETVGVQVKEAPIDLWIFWVVLALSCLLFLLNWSHVLASYQSFLELEGSWMASFYPEEQRQIFMDIYQKQMPATIKSMTLWSVLSISCLCAVLLVATFRRRRTGRI